MNLISQLLLALAAAGAATYALLELPALTTLHMGLVIALATCFTPIVARLVAGGRGSSHRNRRKSRSNRDRNRDNNRDNNRDSNRDNNSTDEYTGDDAERETGEVKWFNTSKGFGFIRRDDGEEFFVHFRSIRNGNKGQRGLKDGQPVSFVVVESNRGPQAKEVDVL